MLFLSRRWANRSCAGDDRLKANQDKAAATNKKKRQEEATDEIVREVYVR